MMFHDMVAEDTCESKLTVSIPAVPGVAVAASAQAFLWAVGYSSAAAKLRILE